MNDVVLAKAEIMERSIQRVQDTFNRYSDDLENLFDAQDVILLNLQRSCEAAIDLAMHLVRIKNLGLPKDSRHAFTLLALSGWISAELAESMRRMVGFRNIAVHGYRSIDWAVVRSIIAFGLPDLRTFANLMVQQHGLP